MPRRHRPGQAPGQLTLWDELTGPADLLPGAPVLAEPKPPSAPPTAGADGGADAVPDAVAVGDWAVGEALNILGHTPRTRAREIPPGLSVRWPLPAAGPCGKCGAGPVGRRRYRVEGLAVVVCALCGNDGKRLEKLVDDALDAWADAGGLC